MVKIDLKPLIKQKGLEALSYGELAKRMDIDVGALYRMMNGKEDGKQYNPSMDMLNRLCRFFKCTPGDFLIFKNGK